MYNKEFNICMTSKLSDHRTDTSNYITIHYDGFYRSREEG